MPLPASRVPWTLHAPSLTRTHFTCSESLPDRHSGQTQVLSGTTNMLGPLSRLFQRRDSSSSSSRSTSASNRSRERERDPLAPTPPTKVSLNGNGVEADTGTPPHLPQYLHTEPPTYPHARPPNSLRLILDPPALVPAPPSDGANTPLLARRLASHLSGSASTVGALEGHYSGPSHVQWKTPTPTTATTTHSGSTITQVPPRQQRESGAVEGSPVKSADDPHLSVNGTHSRVQSISMSRSASSPSLVSPLSTHTGSAAPSVLQESSAKSATPPSSVGRQSAHSLRLAIESPYASGDSDIESEPSVRNAPGNVLGFGLFSGGTGNGNGNGDGNGAHNGNGVYNGNENPRGSFPKQLSPIHEQQVPFPPRRKLSLDSVPRTPDSTRTFDRLSKYFLPFSIQRLHFRRTATQSVSSAAQNAFLHRPLKRSLSQTSASTHRSTVSAVPPVIPPLDLRPNFQTAVGAGASTAAASASAPAAPPPQLPLAMPVPRKSRLPQPTLPTVVGSPRAPNMVSVIYEDGASVSASARSSSFVTAPSPVSPTTPDEQHRHSLGLDLAALYVDPSALRVSDGTDDTGKTGSTGRTGGTGETARRLPAGLVDEHGRLLPSPVPALSPGARPSSLPTDRPNNPTPPSAHSRLSVPHSLPPPQPRPHSRGGGSSTTDETFLQERWLKGLSFGSGDRVVFPPTTKPARCSGGAQLLFWLGFIAPWCWLVGGWLLARDGAVRAEEHGPLLPLWRRVGQRGKRRGSADTAVASVEGKGRVKTKSWYPLVAPSLDSLAASNGGDVRVKKDRRRAADPWVMRCRIAAAVSGLLILGGFVVAMVFVAGVRP